MDASGIDRKLSAILLLLLFCFTVFVCSVCVQPVNGQTRKPNIIFIITDDQRWDSLGATGNTLAKTPNIDRLAREGASFRNFFTTTPLCSPSRASFLTGRYAHTHGVINNDLLNPSAESASLIGQVE
jgi:predicted AlkP superfamily pyrophosphatase or phosphodiesterase